MANTAVGFGDPETVTVAAVGLGEGFEPLPEFAMAKRWDEPYIIPDVELRKRR